MNRHFKTSVIILTLCFNYSTAQWYYLNGPVNNVGNVSSLAVTDSNIFAGTTNGGVLSYSSSSKMWTRIDTGLSSSIVYSLMLVDGNLFAGIWGGAFLSTNYGAKWDNISHGLNHNSVLSLAENGEFIFAGAYYGGVYRKTKNDTNWISSGLGINSVYCLAVNGPNIFAGTWGSGIYLSTNNGENWNSVNNGLINNGIFSLAMSGQFIIAGTNTGLCLSTNNGSIWFTGNSGLIDIPILSIAVLGSNIFAGTYQNGIYLSTNSGTSWRLINEGLSPSSVYSLAIHNSSIFAGTEYGVWKRSLTELTTVHNPILVTPTSFQLIQNYPNPFNPSTTFSFILPSKSTISLKVYNILGKEIGTIVSEELQAGYYSYQWHPTDLASGVYFYKLDTDKHSETKKLLLLK